MASRGAIGDSLRVDHRSGRTQSTSKGRTDGPREYSPDARTLSPESRLQDVAIAGATLTAARRAPHTSARRFQDHCRTCRRLLEKNDSRSDSGSSESAPPRLIERVVNALSTVHEHVQAESLCSARVSVRDPCRCVPDTRVRRGLTSHVRVPEVEMDIDKEDRHAQIRESGRSHRRGGIRTGHLGGRLLRER